MKILCVIDSLGSGGAQRQLVGLAIGFKERGHDVSFLVYHDENFFRKPLDEEGIPVNKIIEPKYIIRLFKIRRFIRSGNFDSVLSFLESPNLICELSGIPSRNWKLVVGERSADPKILKLIKSRTLRWLHLFADHIVANSNENIRMIREANFLLTPQKCHVIYNILDIDVFKPAINYHFRDKGITNLVIVGSHQFLKNLNGLVEAVNILSSDEKKLIRVNWYGALADGSFELAKKKIEEYGLKETFRFHPPTREIHTVLQQADIVGIFSFYEGLPNVLCEAMACSKPVIASAVGDLPIHLVEPELLFDPHDSRSIANVISRIFTLSNEALSQIGYRNLLYSMTAFNKGRIVSEYLELLTP